MSTYSVRARARVAGPKGRAKVRHLVAGRDVSGDVVSLLIAKYPADDGWYLLYFDVNGQELTDTYHDSVASAMAQAEYEFGLSPDEWDHLEGWPQ